MLFRLVISLVTIVFPWQIRRLLLNALLGYKIHSTARIGFSIIIPEQLEMDSGARIGNLNVCKTIRMLKMKENSVISTMNWITAGAPQNSKRFFNQRPDRNSLLSLGHHASITLRHIIDCTDKVEIGCFATIAGYNSQIITHSINLIEAKQSCSPILIGDYCMVGTNCVILPGAILPNYCVLGASSLLNKELTQEYALYGGVPVKFIKKITPDISYFTRKTGYIE